MVAMVREKKNQECVAKNKLKRKIKKNGFQIFWLKGIRVCLVSIPNIKKIYNKLKPIGETDLGKEIRSCVSALSFRCLLDIQVKIPSRL